MKTTLRTLCAALFLGSALWLSAAEPTSPPTPPVIKHSPEFEHMKSLIGTWAGQMDMGQGPMDFSVQYRLIAAGSVLEERCMMNTPNEMVSMYYDEGGKLAMTHYCMMGNRPAMKVAAADANSITFDFDASCCTIDTQKEAHMHGTSIHFDDANTITTSCKALVGGQEMPGHAITLKRVETKTAAK